MIVNLPDIENILIVNLLPKIPLINDLLLKESCKFFNNIINQDEKFIKSKSFCQNKKKEISDKDEIKIYNIFIGQIKIYKLLNIELDNIYLKIQKMVEKPNYGIIDFCCINCQIFNFDIRKISIINRKNPITTKLGYKFKSNKKFLICNHCLENDKKEITKLFNIYR